MSHCTKRHMDDYAKTEILRVLDEVQELLSMRKLYAAQLKLRDLELGLKEA